MSKINTAEKKAETLIKWLEENSTDKALRLNAGTYIRDPKRFIKTHAASLRTTKVLSTAWRAYYMNLWQLKAHYTGEVVKPGLNKRVSREHPERQVVKTRKDHVCRKCDCKVFKDSEAVLIYKRPKPVSERDPGDISKWDRYYLHLNCE